MNNYSFFCAFVLLINFSSKLIQATAIVRIGNLLLQPPCVLVEIFKSKSLSPRQDLEPPFCPDLKLTFALGISVHGFTSWESFEI